MDEIDDVRGVLKSIGLSRYFNTFISQGIHDMISLRKRGLTLLRAPQDHEALASYFVVYDRMQANADAREQALQLLQDTVQKIHNLSERREAIMTNVGCCEELMTKQLEVLLDEIAQAESTMKSTKLLLETLDANTSQQSVRSFGPRHKAPTSTAYATYGGDDENDDVDDTGSSCPLPHANHGFIGSKVRPKQKYTDPCLHAGVAGSGPALRGMKAFPTSLGVNASNHFAEKVHLRSGAFGRTHKLGSDDDGDSDDGCGDPFRDIPQMTQAARTTTPRTSRDPTAKNIGPGWNRGAMGKTGVSAPRSMDSALTRRTIRPLRSLKSGGEFRSGLAVQGKVASYTALGVSASANAQNQMLSGCVKTKRMGY
eukprot:PhM_4_TR2943/c0_g1_i1/m.61907